MVHLYHKNPVTSATTVITKARVPTFVRNLPKTKVEINTLSVPQLRHIPALLTLWGLEGPHMQAVVAGELLGNEMLRSTIHGDTLPGGKDMQGALGELQPTPLHRRQTTSNVNSSTRMTTHETVSRRGPCSSPAGTARRLPGAPIQHTRCGTRTEGR